jgi:hypothetical protein
MADVEHLPDTTGIHHDVRRGVMMIKNTPIAMLLGVLAAAASARAQTPDLHIPRNVQQAYEAGTRSWDGTPGPAYWQNRADYDIRVDFDPVTGLLRGRETITYVNNSPDTLRALILDIHANYYRIGTARDWPHSAVNLGEGAILDQISIDGAELDPSPGAGGVQYMQNGMLAAVPHVLTPGRTAVLDVTWHYTVNHGSHMRTGRVATASYFVAYFFPRVAVYDDVDGWDVIPYSGNLEFYNDFGDFDLTVAVPQGTLVWATGLLQNPEEILTERYARRYAEALTADTIVQIVDSTKYLRQDITAAADRNMWKFRAEYVSDVAFAVSDHYLWDATSIVVDSAAGRRVLVEAAYADTSADFYEVAQIARDAIEIMSQQVPGVPFPFPNMTVFNGLDEMEYPMMVNDHSIKEGRRFVVWLTSHEIFHSYFPFYMGINETKYAWMDEGWATFGDHYITNKLHPEEWSNIFGMDRYQPIVGTHVDIPIFAASDYSKRPAYFYSSYPKPAFFYLMLQDLLGKEMFFEALHEYMGRWNGKHPTPWDFFFTFNDVTGQDLSWLYRPWFFEFGYPDLGLRGVSRQGNGYRIEIERVGRSPVPVHVTITYADGSIETAHAPVSVWQDGDRVFTLEVPTDSEIREVALGADHIPDGDKSDNEWVAR